MPAAAALLAERHRRERRTAPLLPDRFEREAEAGATLADVLRRPGVTGVVAVEAGRVVGFLAGFTAETGEGAGRAAFVPPCAHAVGAGDDGTLRAALYGAMADEWVAEGVLEHHVQVGAVDEEAAPWSNLGFGGFLVLALAALPLSIAAPTGVDCRQAGDGDLDVVVSQMQELRRHHARGPIFLPGRSLAAERVEQRDVLADPRSASWVARRGGTPVGALTLRPPGPGISPLHVPAATIHLVDATTTAAARGTGVGSALLEHALGWAHAIGYRHCALHVHAANAEAARFWTARGFRPVARLLVRRVDPRLVAARP